MSLTFTPISINSLFHGARLNLPTFSSFPIHPPPASSLNLCPTLQFPLSPRKLSIVTASLFGEVSADDFDWGDTYDDGVIDEEDEGSPWEGAVVYKRSSSVSHVEYCTTLERLGLTKISSELSRSRAAAMGLRLTKAVKEFLDGTPVLVSVDVNRKKRDVIRLDGIVRTVISLDCNRCGEPAAESIFSNFTLLLTDEPVKELEVINMGIIYGENKPSSSSTVFEDEGDEASIDLEDRLYFPPEDKEIDISKNIRDLVHLEITINAVCGAKCKGLCLKCGVNLNTDRCNCDKEEIGDVVSRPLGHLKKQMQQK
ncbi:hypothetical protein V2J09_011525 [Rumex salicifolius]